MLMQQYYSGRLTCRLFPLSSRSYPVLYVLDGDKSFGMTKEVTDWLTWSNEIRDNCFNSWIEDRIQALILFVESQININGY